MIEALKVRLNFKWAAAAYFMIGITNGDIYWSLPTESLIPGATTYRSRDKIQLQKMLSQTPKPQTQKSVAFHTLAFCPWHYDLIPNIHLHVSRSSMYGDVWYILQTERTWLLSSSLLLHEFDIYNAMFPFFRTKDCSRSYLLIN